MGRRAIELGPTASTVARNLKRFRAELRGWTLADLAERMTEVGRPMTANTLSAIETQARRIDVDDLIALAAALGISPAALLMPHVTPEDTPDPDDPSLLAEKPLITSAEPNDGDVPRITAGQYWDWLIADSPLDSPLLMDERDEFAIEAWRRDQVPVWAYRPRTRGVDRG
ncbi:helix-turn-helix domain-containing protein [Mycolicibacterium smegmatis]|uniref:helix-turn-helix domain-containing protein n=1 Tax=Mycolicibacterium smegmatis TaxID=1772 RepID=UPI0020A32CA8|nr:helix-turn-helix transcriptional regulator [Mycolicibacterium smegmatis]MCP2628126.1 helix-turn-helix domain-containing protein [Mycolicibacterium smegmatis]